MGNQKLPRAISKEGKIFGSAVCYVLEDGRRVVTKRSMVSVLGGGREGGDLTTYIKRIPKGSELLAVGANVSFVLPSGGKADGTEGSTIAKMLRLYAEAWSAGALRANQVPVAQRAVAMLAQLGEIGIIALIDEATGHQEKRPKDELQKRLLEMIREEQAEIDPIYKPLLVALAKLKRSAYRGSGTPPAWAPKVANIVTTCIWGDEGRMKLRRLNPNPSWGHRDPQHLDDEGKKLLVRTLGIAEAYAHTAKSWTHWKNQMESYFKGFPIQEWMF